jgi:hypothetical protein
VNDTDDLFDLELAAVRAGLPGAIPLPSKITTHAERGYLEGLSRAAERDPDELHQLAARCTVDEHGKAHLPGDAPADLPTMSADRAKLLALLEPRS